MKSGNLLINICILICCIIMVTFHILDFRARTADPVEISNTPGSGEQATEPGGEAEATLNPPENADTKSAGKGDRTSTGDAPAEPASKSPKERIIGTIIERLQAETKRAVGGKAVAAVRLDLVAYQNDQATTGTCKKYGFTKKWVVREIIAGLNKQEAKETSATEKKGLRDVVEVLGKLRDGKLCPPARK